MDENTNVTEPSEVERVKNLEEENLEISKKNLGGTYTLAHDINELYTILSNLLSIAKTPVDRKFYVNCALLLSCRYQFTISCLATIRGHLTDSLQSTRRAIESCAFAYRIFKHPSFAEVWINAGDDDESYTKYRKSFSGMRTLFPENNPVMKFLGERYDFCSKQMHSTIHSFATRLKTEKIEKGINFRFMYCDIPPDDPLQFYRTFFATINIHRHILKAFSEIFQEEIEQDKTKWEVNYNAVEAKYGVHLKPCKDKMMNI